MVYFNSALDQTFHMGDLNLHLEYKCEYLKSDFIYFPHFQGVASPKLIPRHTLENLRRSLKPSKICIILTSILVAPLAKFTEKSIF